MKKIFALLTALFVTLICAACGNNAPASADANFVTVTDDLNREVTLKNKPQRIVVTSASFLEPLHEVGGDVVARPDSKTKMPDWAKDKPSVGKVYAIDLERVLAANPDLVIVNKGMNEKLLGALGENNIPAMVIDMKSYEDVKREVMTFAAITEQKERGAQINAQMDVRIKAVKDKIPAESTKRVAILHSTNQGLTVQLNGSIAGSVATMLGFVNVAADMEALTDNPDAAPYSMETLVEQNPEIIFVTSMGDIDAIKADFEQLVADNPAWQSIPAIREHHLYYLPQDLFLLSPGLHYPDAAEYMAKLVYPQNF